MSGLSKISYWLKGRKVEYSNFSAPIFIFGNNSVYSTIAILPEKVMTESMVAMMAKSMMTKSVVTVMAESMMTESVVAETSTSKKWHDFTSLIIQFFEIDLLYQPLGINVWIIKIFCVGRKERKMG
jgi:hypothetical protein